MEARDEVPLVTVVGRRPWAAFGGRGALLSAVIGMAGIQPALRLELTGENRKEKDGLCAAHQWCAVIGSPPLFIVC